MIVIQREQARVRAGSKQRIKSNNSQGSVHRESRIIGRETLRNVAGAKQDFALKKSQRAVYIERGMRFTCAGNQR